MPFFFDVGEDIELGEGAVTQEVTVDPVPSDARSAYTLQIVQGPRVGSVFEVERDHAVMGRGADADLRIPDPGLSRCHARFDRRGNALLVTDLQSRNGTFVEGERVAQPTTLHEGDRVTVGNVTLRFSLAEPNVVRASQEIYEAAVRDNLTRMHNRGFFDERLSAEWAYARRHGAPLAVLLVDVDHFKRVNDTFGHQVGDMVLQAVAAAIRRTVRAEDAACRYGGEEFAVLARGTSEDGAIVLAQRIRTRITNARVPAGGGEIGVTASIGVAVSGRTSPESAKALVAAADESLYTAKRSGRDRVVLHRGPQRPTEAVDTSYRVTANDQFAVDQVRNPAPVNRTVKSAGKKTGGS